MPIQNLTLTQSIVRSKANYKGFWPHLDEISTNVYIPNSPVYADGKAVGSHRHVEKQAKTLFILSMTVP